LPVLTRSTETKATLEDYKAGYVLYAFDLIADHAESDHFYLMKHGSLRLALRFFAN